jgi:hypothetical protein
MTDYNEWNKFDENGALKALDIEIIKEDFDEIKRNNDKAYIKESIEIQNNTKKAADILRSKAAVAELLASGSGPSRRRRNKDKEGNLSSNTVFKSIDKELNEDSNNNNISNSLESNLKLLDTTMTEIISNELEERDYTTLLANVMDDISDKLASIMKDLEILRQLSSVVVTTGKKGNTIDKVHISYQQGFDLGLIILYDIASISDLKNIILNLQESSLSDAILKNKLNPNNSIDNNPNVIKSESTVIIIEGIDKSIGFTSSQTITFLSLCALNIGEYSVAADLIRCRMKQSISIQTDLADSTHWVLRGLSFAGMNCPYLCAIHFRQAKELSPSYPGIDSVNEYLEKLELSYSVNNKLSSFHALINNELHNTLVRYNVYNKTKDEKDDKVLNFNGATLSDIRYLTVDNVSKYFSSSTLKLSIDNKTKLNFNNYSPLENVPLHIEDNELLNEAKSKSNLNNENDINIDNIINLIISSTLVENLNNNIDIFHKLVEISRKIFYEAQV